MELQNFAAARQNQGIPDNNAIRNRQQPYSQNTSFNSQNNLFNPTFILLLLQLIQQILLLIQSENPPEPQTLDLSQDDLQQLTNALNLGLAFAGGSGPNIVRVTDDNQDGVLSPGDTAFTEGFNFTGGEPLRSSFTVTQELLDISARLQAQVPQPDLSISEFRAVANLTDGSFRHIFDNDRNGALSIGDEIVKGIGENTQIVIVDSAFLDRFNQEI